MDILRQHHPMAVVMPLIHLGGQTREIFRMDEIDSRVRETFKVNVSPGGRFAYILDKLQNILS
ncbi:MAG: hypothetical protein H7832_06820 [Magnetococcus sp. DMHC-6]